MHVCKPDPGAGGKKNWEEALGRRDLALSPPPHTLLPKEEKEEKNRSVCVKKQKGCRLEPRIFFF